MLRLPWESIALIIRQMDRTAHNAKDRAGSGNEAREKREVFGLALGQRGKAMPGKGMGKASRDTTAGMMLERPWGSSPKGGLPMDQFLLDMAAQVAAGVIVALFAYWLNLR